MAAANLATTPIDPALQLMVVIASLSLLPFMVVSMTSFLRYIIVLSILKTAMGTQGIPPAIVLSGMALILTFYTMAPVFQECIERVEPMMAKKPTVVQLFNVGSEPLKEFMLRQTQESDVAFFVSLSRDKAPQSPKELSIFDVAPAYILSELRTAFQIGFIIFIPFIVLDMVVANILLAMGMMMLSPTIISLPFKILIFVAVDGWGLILRGLIQSFN